VAHVTSKVIIVTPIQTWCADHKTSIGSKAHHNIIINLFDERVNLYNSKPIAVIPHVPVYHVIRCNLIFTFFYMHAFINSSFSLSYYHHSFSQNKVHNNQKCIYLSCKYACLVVHKIIMLCRKNNNKYLCEFYSLAS
jgi:hypothetical protein